MTDVDAFLKSIDEVALTIPYAEARLSFQLRSDSVPDMESLDDVHAEYYIHLIRWVFPDTTISRIEALARAYALLEHDFGRMTLLVSALRAGHAGPFRNLREVLDVLADSIRLEYFNKRFQKQIQRYAGDSPSDRTCVFTECLQHLALLGQGPKEADSRLRNLK
jgi:hypothetical protein